MHVYQFSVGDVVVDPNDGQTLKIVQNISKHRTKATVITPSSDTSSTRNVIGKTYTYNERYGSSWKLSKNPVNSLDSLKKELEQAKANVEKIEASITKIKESLSLKPGTMYKSGDHFDGQTAIFMNQNSGEHEFYLGGEFRNIKLDYDDLEKFQPLTLPNQRKMTEAVVAFIEGRIPNN